MNSVPTWLTANDAKTGVLERDGEMEGLWDGRKFQPGLPTQLFAVRVRILPWLVVEETVSCIPGWPPSHWRWALFLLPSLTSQAPRWPFWPPCVAHKDFWEHKSWGHSPDSICGLSYKPVTWGRIPLRYPNTQICAFALCSRTSYFSYISYTYIYDLIPTSLSPNVMLCKNVLHLFVLYTRENRYTGASRSQFSSSTRDGPQLIRLGSKCLYSWAILPA